MPKAKIITGLDIGTSAIKLLVVSKKPGEPELEVVFQGRESSLGIRRGVVVNVEEVSEKIRSLLRKAQDSIGQRVNSVYINIGGSHIFSTVSHGLVSVSRADQKISEGDIERVLQAAQTFSLPSNKEIIDVFPKEFIVDGEKGIKEVLGMEGVRLETEVLAIGGFSPYLENLNQAVLGANLQILDRVPSPIAAARACLTPRQKELGVVLLDIGAGTTGMAVFEEGDLIHLAILPIGSAHITNDIAIGFKIDIDIAERIKIEYGSLAKNLRRKKEKIKLSEGETLVFSRKQLGDIIEARVSEIFGEVDKELKKISRKELLPAGVVLTGGGSKLPQIVQTAKNELKLPCRTGKPKDFLGLERDPTLTTVCGLVLRGVDLETQEPSSFLRNYSSGLTNFFSKLKRIFKIFIP